MMHVDEGELVELNSEPGLGQNIGGDRCAESKNSCEAIDVHVVTKKGSSGDKLMDINR